MTQGPLGGRVGDRRVQLVAKTVAYRDAKDSFHTEIQLHLVPEKSS
jgi:hypothetical protein